MRLPFPACVLCAQVRTRTFSEEVGGEGVTLMVPFADLANHSFTQNGTFRLSKDKTRCESTCLLYSNFDTGWDGYYPAVCGLIGKMIIRKEGYSLFTWLFFQACP